ncbi:N-acetylneuraminate lyase B-like [Sitodiplosis mosellana]|uniref:N-acetylneuraminate lyase B-like n=1 Tax=Sitodiplosis mosellana TaxID=263140 RepID=UPI0024437E76|nr:N-acetylneuraminate lyase B-like [Sitodiplosis mosellana]
MKTDFMFKGMMVPVFTPFNDDKKHSINYEVIDKYANYLKSMGMQGIMLNGMTGEGMTLTVDERKKLTEKWLEVTRKYDLRMLLNIGGIDLADVYELAEHAEKLKVDAVMVTPDLFYKPKTEEDLMYYLKDIMARMPTRPMFYYHIPMFTQVYLDWYYFLTQYVEKEIPTFAGFYYADDRIDKVIYLKHKLPEYNYIIGVGSAMMGLMAEGFDAISMTAMNLYPEMVKELYDYMLGYKMHEAYILKEKMIKKIYDLFQTSSNVDWLRIMKMEMDKLHPQFKVGPMRKPKLTKMMWWSGKY